MELRYYQIALKTNVKMLYQGYSRHLLFESHAFLLKLKETEFNYSCNESNFQINLVLVEACKYRPLCTIGSDYEREFHDKGIFAIEPRTSNSLFATYHSFSKKSAVNFFCVRPQRYIQTFKYGNADAEELWDAIGEVGILVTYCVFIK